MHNYKQGTENIILECNQVGHPRKTRTQGDWQDNKTNN